MSYNITTWKVRSIRLEMPIAFSFQEWLKVQPSTGTDGYENVGKRWCLEDGSTIQCDLSDGTWKLCASGQTLSGSIQGDKLIASDPHALEWAGDGSGHLYSGILIPLFEAFKGDLDAIVVWEGGDSIYHLTIVSGTVRENEIQ
jgi:hypothetical protein